jgi:preprotein translocase subunit SecD
MRELSVRVHAVPTAGRHGGPRKTPMNTPTNEEYPMSTLSPNWKIAAAAGAIAGVGMGGFVMAGIGNDVSTPGGVVLDQFGTSVQRLSAPVVLPAVPQPASIPQPVAPAVAPPMVMTPASVDSPPETTTTTIAVAPPAASEPSSPDSPAPAPAPVSVDSPDSPAPAPAPAPADSPDSPASPPAPAADSPASPASPGSAGSS